MNEIDVLGKCNIATSITIHEREDLSAISAIGRSSKITMLEDVLALGYETVLTGCLAIVS